MKKIRNSAALAFVIVCSMFCGVGCIAETNEVIDDEIEDTDYETEDLGTDSNIENVIPVENETSNTNDPSGVCGPPCTKI